MPASAVVRLRRIGLVVADLAAAERFYSESFGFRHVSKLVYEDPAFAKFSRLGQVRSSTTVMRLERDELELASYNPQGLGYPTGSTVADLWFQHIAIVVEDMTAAYDVLRQSGKIIPISTDGPEQLPPNTGSVTAFKFRDPEGHPIELSKFPPGVGAARWREPKSGGTCLGIDHSAVSVADVTRSIDFYCGVLGMKVTARSVNRGPEQDRLDGLTSDGVDIVALQPADEASPHIELLGYHPPGRAAGMLRENDIAATRLTLQVDDLPSVVGRLRAADPSFVSPGLVTLESGESAALMHDPDGHLLLLVE